MNTTGLSASELGTWAVTPAAEDDYWGNSTDSTSWDGFYSMTAMFLVTVLVSLLGLVGNGTVIWLLGFRMKRNPFSVYILNLACADFLFLLSSVLEHIFRLTASVPQVIYSTAYSTSLSSYLVELCLLMAVSTDRCVSAVCPIWYRCHRPAHLSSALCALVWALGSCSGTAWLLCFSHTQHLCYALDLVFCVTSVLTCLVLCASSLKLLLRVQCCSRRRRPGKLYLSLLLNVLAFLLLGMPYGVQVIVQILMSPLYSSLVLEDTFYFLAVLNSVVNPIIYFFVGRCRQPHGRKRLREVLQSALTPEEGLSMGGDPDLKENSLCTDPPLEARLSVRVCRRDSRPRCL